MPFDYIADHSENASLNRRAFLGSSAKNAAGVAAGLVSLSAMSSPILAGSNDPVRLGIIGVRNQGRILAETLARLTNAHVVALCDVDATVLPAACRAVESVGSRTPRCEKDFRRLLDDPNIDAICIATPDHWHAAMMTLACRAGKDVYIESPVTHTLEEGERLQQVAAATGRVVQVGLQQRSGAHFRSAVEFLRSGQLGKVTLAKAWTVHQRKSIGRKADGAAPAGLDYEAWLGPASRREFNPNRFHFNWHWFWDYGAGELGNWGVHLLDVARWGLGVEFPETVAASGGKHFFQDDQETPDTLHVQYGFPGKTITWEHRLWSNQTQEGRSAATAFYGEKGTLIVDRSGWKVYGGTAAQSASGDLLSEHLQHFLHAVHTRQTPVCDLRTGHVSGVLCHLGNVAHRVGHSLTFDGRSQSCVNDEAANALLRPGSTTA